MNIVIDASALVAVLLQEAGGDFVYPHLRGSRLSAVNFSESLHRVVERGGKAVAVEAIVLSYEIGIAPFTADQARVAAELREPTRYLGLSLGDRSCLALARLTDSMILTADSRMARYKDGFDIRMIR